MLGHFLIVCLGVCATLVQGDSHDGCYSNQTSCVAEFREFLLDTDRFWFGDRFKTECAPGAPRYIACDNPDDSRLSVLSRLLNLRDDTDSTVLSEKASAIGLAHVTFTAPGTTIYACGHDFYIPSVTDEKIDPFHITKISLWSLDKLPSVTWDPESPETKYTVIVWDVGYFFIHGLYINCVNGTMSTGEAIDVYSGPRNANFAGNAYIFAVYKQTTDVNAAQATGILNSIIFQNQLRFYPTQYVNASRAAMADSPSHAMVMTVVGGPFSIQFQKDFRIVNRCPMLVSQLPAFHQVVHATNISVSWSNENLTNSQLRDSEFVSSLSVAMEIEYSTDDFTVQSCCEEFSITRGMFRTDPFSDRPQRAAMARLTPRVKLNEIYLMDRTSAVRDMTFTLICVDVAPALVEGAMNPQLVTHWMVTNIKNADIDTGDHLAPYFGPNPFTANSPRAYMFLLYKQHVPMLNNSILDEFCPDGGLRCRIHLADVLEAFGLTELSGLSWFLAEQDAFARKRVYDVLKARPMDQVCQNIPGYSNPCPAKCANSAHSMQFSVTFTFMLSMLYTFISSC